jgi:hypothetical protein
LLLEQLARGVEVMMHLAVSLRDQVTALQKANEAATKRKSRRKKRMQKRRTSKKAEGIGIIA